MAALPESLDPQAEHARVVELRQISAGHLEAVLEEEIAAWQTELNWDLRHSADLVRRFVQMQALNGFALMIDSQVLGYSYYICEESKGLIGDLYLSANERTPERENLLLEATVDALRRSPGIRRVESQLLMLGGPLGRTLPFANRARSFPRWFMEAPAQIAADLKPRSTPTTITRWLESHHDESARVVAASYRGHVDGEINDQYRSTAGARRFLSNIVQYPGCGTYFAPASYAAFDGGAICGISLTSLVANNAGHITQVCIAPSHRGTGLGYELLRRSMVALAAHGCSTVSLTVTTSNRNATDLYERMGFQVRRTFAAHVWDLR